MITKNIESAEVLSDDKDSYNDDLFEFAEESSSQIMSKGNEPWKILIVDDDEEIHSVTKLVLADFNFEDRSVKLLHAYSGKEAIEVLQKEDDIALILLDVVMETDDSGLKCVKEIREKLNNYTVRIILRTGQPGQAPEQDVIVNYDINDYKAKTELTAQKLFTVVISSLRSYQQLNVINQNRKGLENIIEASRSFFKIQSFNIFASGILKQLISILGLDESYLLVNTLSMSALKDNEGYRLSILTATGEFEGTENRYVDEVVSEKIQQSLTEAVNSKESIFTPTSYTGYFGTTKGELHLLYLQWKGSLTEVDRNLISIFTTNVSVAFENISLNNEIIATQKEIIFTLSEVVEGRSKETANHIRRVAEVSCMIARNLGFSDHEIEVMKLAAPMHDIGKVSTPDSILKKPGKLTHEEYEIMKTHSTLGYNILKSSSLEMLKASAIIAHQHHEKWNGTGYPKGLKGDGIHIYGRIVALADVLDALSNKRCYKDPWEKEKILDLIKDEKGKHFDPKVVDAFLEDVDEYYEIQRKFAD